MIDRTFRAGEKFRPIHTEARKMQFLYADGTDAHFMDEESYEQIALPETSMAEPLKWVKPNESVDMLYIDGNRRTSSSAPRWSSRSRTRSPASAATRPPAAATSPRRWRRARP